MTIEKVNDGKYALTGEQKDQFNLLLSAIIRTDLSDAQTVEKLSEFEFPDVSSLRSLMRGGKYKAEFEAVDKMLELNAIPEDVEGRGINSRGFMDACWCAAAFLIVPWEELDPEITKMADSTVEKLAEFGIGLNMHELTGNRQIARMKRNV